MKKILVFIVLLLSFSLSFAEEKRFVIPLEDSPSYGPNNAPVTIIEFLDFQ